jgi:hypothetical protein
MANVTLDICSTSETDLSLTYDDVTLLIASISFTNNGATGTLTLTLLNRLTQAVIYQRSRAFNTGTFVDDVTARILHMIPTTGKDGSHGVGLPAIVQCGWTST